MQLVTKQSHFESLKVFPGLWQKLCLHFVMPGIDTVLYPYIKQMNLLKKKTVIKEKNVIL